VVAIAPFGLHWESEEAIVRLVFLVISLKDDPEIHLNILAEIARMHQTIQLCKNCIGMRRPKV